MATLSIVLVNFKRAQDTIACVESLRASSFRDFDIIIVDNNSGDGSAEVLKKHCGEATLIVNQTNCGFAEGNNIGIREALKRGSAFVLLLNNDTIVHVDALDWLVATMRAHPTCGIAGAKIFFHDSPELLWFAGGYFNRHAGFGGHCGMNQPDSDAYSLEQPTDYVTGCCMMVRREVFESVGLLDSDYFAYLEDVDFCIRARDKGYVILYQPKAIIYHKISKTSTWDSPVYIYFNLRNKILFLRKNSSPRHWSPYLPKLIYFYARQLIRLIFKWRDMSAARAALMGVTDGLKGYAGEFGKGRLEMLPSSKRQREEKR